MFFFFGFSPLFLSNFYGEILNRINRLTLLNLMEIKMGNCSECGKKLRFREGYRHPVLGEKYLVCSDCFDVIDKSIEFYNKCLFEGRQKHKKAVHFYLRLLLRITSLEYFTSYFQFFCITYGY